MSSHLVEDNYIYMLHREEKAMEGKISGWMRS